MACAVLNEQMPEADDIDPLLEEFRGNGREVYDNAMKAILKRKETASGLPFKDTDISAAKNESSVNGASSSRGSTATRGGRGSRGTTAAKTTTARATTAAKANGNTTTTRGGRSTRGTQQTLAQSMARSSTRASNKNAVIYMSDSD